MTSTFAVHSVARVVALFSTLALGACRGEDPGGTETGSSTTGDSTTGDGSTTADVVPTTTGDGSTTVTDDSTTTTTEVTTTMGASVGFIPDTTGSGAPQPNGGSCTNDDECESMNCYTSPLMPNGGVCSECNEDQDCVDAGTGISCTVGGQGFATCEDGSLGNQCMSQAACQEGLFCEAVIEIPIPGVVPDTCSECQTSDDCADMAICTPQIDMASFSGQKVCVQPGSVPNDQLCPHDQPDGDDACMSGHCTVATFMNIVMLGLCGECETDADCMAGTCQPAMAGQGGVSGSVCQ